MLSTFQNHKASPVMEAALIAAGAHNEIDMIHGGRDPDFLMGLCITRVGDLSELIFASSISNSMLDASSINIDC